MKTFLHRHGNLLAVWSESTQLNKTKVWGKKKKKNVKALPMLSGSHAFNEDLKHSLKVCGRWRTSALNNLDFTLSALLLYNLILTSWMEEFRSPHWGELEQWHLLSLLSPLCSFVSSRWKLCSSVRQALAHLSYAERVESSVKPFVCFQTDPFLWRTAFDGTWLFNLD